jgi:hypothetical protein
MMLIPAFAEAGDDGGNAVNDDAFPSMPPRLILSLSFDFARDMFLYLRKSSKGDGCCGIYKEMIALHSGSGGDGWRGLCQKNFTFGLCAIALSFPQ